MPTIWNFPTRIIFGQGSVRDLGEHLSALGVRRALLVTDAGVQSAGLTDPCENALRGRGIAFEIFSGVETNPTESNIEAGARAYAEASADGVIGLGGGSPLDAAKLIALRARCELPFEQLDDAVGGSRHIKADLPPILAIPTTAGTGSEVGRAGVLTLRSTGRKCVVFSPYLLPKVALLEPELSVTMPARVTAATGFDALTHCVEAYLAKGDHPMADAIALGGVELIVRHLTTAVNDGTNLEARGSMLKAAMMGAVAFQKGLGACHSMAHPLSTQFGLHHGLANALCLPAVVDYNEKAVASRVFDVAERLGAPRSPGACAQALRRLRQTLGLPERLGQVGIQASHLEPLSDEAVDDGCHRDNPRACGRTDLLALYQACL